MHRATSARRQSALAATALAVGAFAACAEPGDAEELGDEPLQVDGPFDTEGSDGDLLADDVPHEYSLAGGVVDGFPEHVVPVFPGAQVLVTSAVPGADGLLTVSLNLRSDAAVDALVGYYDDALRTTGFELVAEHDDDALDTRAVYARGDTENLLLAVVDRDGSRTLTVSGQVDPDE